MPSDAAFQRTLRAFHADVVGCSACPRLAAYRTAIGDASYWNRPVPSFGDPRARLVIIGLAPGAHGANRTGRPFTGDYAGDWLYRALFEFGFASRQESESRDDDLVLRDAWITNAVRCVPPENTPATDEVKRCAPFLVREFELLADAACVLALGKTAHDAFLGFAATRSPTKLRRASFPFGHGRRHDLGPGLPLLVDSYHCSRYNTSTRVLTWDMFTDVFKALRTILPAEG